MKRAIVVLLVLALVLVAAAGWWLARTAPDELSQFLIGGGLEASRAEAFVATLGGQSEAVEEALVASGSIEGEEVAIVSELGGRVVQLHADEGDEVDANQVLVELDKGLLEAQMSQAEVQVEAAETNLAVVEAGTHPAEILAAEASLQKAEAERAAARATWEDLQGLLENPQSLEAQIAQAATAVGVADAAIEQAKAQIANAEAERFQYRGQGSMEEKYLYRVHDYQVKAAEAALAKAKAEHEGAEATLAELGAIRDRPLELVSRVHQAEAQHSIAEAGVAAAESKLAELRAGPTPEEVGLAAAQVDQAEAAVTGLQAMIDRMTLRTPISGVVTSRSAHTGEASVAGATLLTVANLDEVKLTIYIPEDELGQVHLGQEVEVQVDSFPGRVFTGTVSHISQEAEFTPKNVQTEKERVNMVFAVKVRLSNPGHLLKPGMPADAILRQE